MSGNKSKQFSLIPCSICGASSSGYHFGAISCESCKVFFCRSLKRQAIDEATKAPYLHRCSGPSTASSVINCQRCRFDKCIAAGMSHSSICIGRHSAERRLQKTLTINKLAEKNQLLSAHISRKRTACVAAQIIVGQSPSITPDDDYIMSKQKTVGTTEACVDNEAKLITSLPKSFPLRNDFPNDHDSILQQTLEAFAHLDEIRKIPNLPPCSPDMSMEQVWSMVMRNHELYTDVVRRFVRALPDFSSLQNISDRIRLFNSAYHSLYSTQLSLDFDSFNQTPKFYSFESGMTQRVIFHRFPDMLDLFHQLSDSGIAISSAQFTRVELSLLCALIFFNPYPLPKINASTPPVCDNRCAHEDLGVLVDDTQPQKADRIDATTRLMDAALVKTINDKYWQIVHKYINGTFPPETAQRRLTVFKESLRYFKQTSALFHHFIVETAAKHPNLIKQNRLFEDWLLKLSADNVKPRSKYYELNDWASVKNEVIIFSS